MEIETSVLMSMLRPERLLAAAVMIAIAGFATRSITQLLDGLGERDARRRLLYKRASSIARFVIFLLAATLVVTNVMALSNEAMLALGGTIAVTVGFALKDTAASLISGILILLDKPFQVGDRISFGDTYGEVVEIGLRSVRITTLDDNLVTIPTNKFLVDSVASANAGQLDMMVQIDFHIALTADFDRALRLARDATMTSRYLFYAKPVFVLLSEAEIGEELTTRVRVRAYVVDARFEGAFTTDLTAKVKRAFRDAAITMPHGLRWEPR